MRTYPVRVARDGKWWLIRATDFDNGFSQARRLADVEQTARDLIALIENTGIEQVAVDITVEHLDDLDVHDLQRSLTGARETVRTAEQRYSALLRDDARQLAAKGLAVRDIGYVLSVSHQRAQQLLDS